MRALYEIDFDLENLVEFDEETGEILNPDVLDKLKAEREQKIEGVALWYKNLDAEAKAIKEEEQMLKKRRESKEHKVESLKKWLDYVLAGNKFETSKVAISYRHSTSVIIEDLDSIPNEFVNTKVETVPDKMKIKEALKAGTVPGARLDEKDNISIK